MLQLQPQKQEIKSTQSTLNIPNDQFQEFYQEYNKQGNKKIAQMHSGTDLLSEISKTQITSNEETKRQSMLEAKNNDNLKKRKSISALNKPIEIKIKKEELNSVEKTQILYLGVIRCVIELAFQYFLNKQQKKSIETLRSLIRLGQLANDLHILMKIHNMIGILTLNKRDFLNAIVEFKILRDIAEEAEEDTLRLHAYGMLGNCYQFMREYENAIKCFKKQLEIAWSKSEYSAEMLAYDKIAINYFYLGDLEKSKYYQERMMRGQFEPKNSKLRKIYQAQQKNRKAEKNLWNNTNTPFFDIKSVFQQFEETLKEQREVTTSNEGQVRLNLQLKNDNDRLLTLRDELYKLTVNFNLRSQLDEISKEEIEKIDMSEESFHRQQNTISLQNEYNTGTIRKERMFLVRAGTPISEIDSNELPSPRGDGDRKATQVLPHYYEEKEELTKPKRIIARKPYEDKNLREILDMLYRNRKYVKF